MKPISFFDDDHAKMQKKIWSKPENDQESIEKIKIVLSKCVWMKKTKKSGKTKPRVFFTDSTYLYMCKSDKTDKISGILELTCVKLDFLQNVEPKPIESTCSELLFGFRMCRNGKTLEFFCKDINLFKKWRNFLALKAIQSTFHEEFIVSKMIGKGSFAKVYLATKKQNGLQFAIKAFNKQFMHGQHKGKESLINEISIMRNFQDENLITLYEVYETTNSIYFVLDLINGGELLHRVRDKGTINEQDLSKLLRNLVSGLYHLHSKGIMHRDLKPENLLLKSKDNDYEIVIADFGLADFTNKKEKLFKRCGTPGFVAPEILQYKEGEPFYDVKCDIFSVGIIFYLLLIGKQPFQAKEYKLILKANKSCDIKYDTKEFASVSNEALDLLKKMLDPIPISRISAKDCLNHPFIFNTEYQKKNELQATFFLRTYEVDYLANVRKKSQVSNSSDLNGSLDFHSIGTPAINGKTDTIDSLSLCSNSIIHSKVESKNTSHLTSIFSKPRSDSIDEIDKKYSNDNQVDNSSKSHLHKNQEGKNLHKIAIKNHMHRGYQDEINDYGNYEDSEDISEENSPLSNSLLKMNIENQKNQFPFQQEGHFIDFGKSTSLGANGINPKFRPK